MYSIASIKNTVEGYKVKDLSFDPVANIIVGLVLDPICGRIELRKGWVSCCWRTNGKPTKKFGGINRPDLNLELLK
jgi:hypothetical protein